MIINYEVIFTSTLPSIEFVVERLMVITGLDIKYDSEKYLLFNAEYEMALPLIAENNLYITIRGYLKIDYLLGATLFTLVSLGGDYKGYIPDWANLKWKDIKDKFDQLPNVGFSTIEQN